MILEKNVERFWASGFQDFGFRDFDIFMKNITFPGFVLPLPRRPKAQDPNTKLKNFCRKRKISIGTKYKEATIKFGHFLKVLTKKLMSSKSGNLIFIA